MNSSRLLLLSGGVWTPAKLFRTADIGAWYDPTELTSMFQESTGTTPVTASGQVVGLFLDKQNGYIRGAELATSMTSNNGSVVYSGGVATYTASAAGNGVVQTILTLGKTYEATFRVVSISSGSIRPNAGNTGSGTTVTTPGTYRQILVCSGNTVAAVSAIANPCTAVVDSVSFKEVSGNHATQSTSGSRPTLNASGKINYSSGTKSLVSTFPSSLGSSCTVAHSIPQADASILTAQTIGTTYTDTTDNCGLVIINRDLTATETNQLRRWLNRRAG
jgi:hypothetical protein